MSWRDRPAIPETPYTPALPAVKHQPGRLEKAATSTYNYFKERTLGEVTLDVMLWGSTFSGAISVAGGLAIGVADVGFDTHIARSMSEVRVDNDASTPERLGQQIVHDIGVHALKIEQSHHHSS